MSLLNDYIDKFAAEKGFDRSREAELVVRAQQGDTVAYKELAKAMNSVIQNGITLSGVSTTNIPKEALRNRAMKEFRRSIETYDPNAGAALATYVTGNIKLDLKKLDGEYKNSSRVSDESTIQMGNISTAKKQLFAEGITNPSEDDISRMVKKNFGKDISPEAIKDLNQRQRRDLSGGKALASPDEAESLYLGDLTNVQDTTGKQYLDQLNDEERLTNAISMLSPENQAIYNQHSGRGEFKANGKAKLADVAKANNMGSEYFVSKKIGEIEDEIRKNVLGE